MQQWLIGMAAVHYVWVYALIILIACAEGPVFSMLFGVVIHLGYFSFWPVYASLMAGDLLGDVIWYEIGRHAGHRFIARFGRYFSITEEGVEKVKKIFQKYHTRILFVSKITNGFGFALVTLMTAGMADIPFWRYLSINVIGQFIWTGLLLSIGYFFGDLYTSVDSILGKIFVAALFVVVFLAFLGYRKYLKQRAEKMEI
jgi:membrane protein DedA with SNARE-associated domain